MGPLIVSVCRGPVFYEIQGRKRSKIMHDGLKPYNSDVVQAWVQRMQSKVLQLSKFSKVPVKQLPEEDSLLVPELPLQEDTSMDLAEDGAPSSPMIKGSHSTWTSKESAGELTSSLRQSRERCENFQWVSSSQAAKIQEVLIKEDC